MWEEEKRRKEILEWKKEELKQDLNEKNKEQISVKRLMEKLWRNEGNERRRKKDEE